MALMSRPRAAGFTLVELLTTVVITLIMMLLIGVLYQQTQQAVSVGIATSDMIHKVRGLSDEMARATSKMVGPSDKGFLIIVNRRYDNIKIKHARLVDTLEGYAVNNLRSDSLTFIRENPSGELRPIAPGTTTAFAPADNANDAPYIKVHLGHLEHVNGDGSPAGTLGTGESGLGHEWTLGLQYLFLDEQDAPSIHAEKGFADADVVGFGGQIPAGVPTKLHLGITDVAYCSFKSATSDAGKPAASGGTQLALLVGTEAHAVLQDAQTMAQYASAAYTLAYAADGHRLKHNRFPSGTAFESWSIAQMHAGLLHMCSEIIVEFAGDYDGVAGIDTDGAGRIKWYGHFAQAETSSYVAPTGANALDDEGAYPLSPSYTTSAEGAPLDGATDGAVFVFRHDDAQRWPHLLRLRYRINDRRGVLEHDADLGPGLRIMPGKWFEQVLTVKRD